MKKLLFLKDSTRTFHFHAVEVDIQVLIIISNLNVFTLKKREQLKTPPKIIPVMLLLSIFT